MEAIWATSGLCFLLPAQTLWIALLGGFTRARQQRESAALSTVATATYSPQEPGNCCPLQQSQASMSTRAQIPETTSSNMITCPCGSASWLDVSGFCKTRLPHICFGLSGTGENQIPCVGPTLVWSVKHAHQLG